MGSGLEFRLCVPPELRWQSGRLLTARSSVRSRVEAHLLFTFFFFQSPGLRTAGLLVTRGGYKVHTGGSSAVEQRTVKCASAYAVILWSGVQISPSECFCQHLFFFCFRRAESWWFWGVQTDEALRSHDSSVHSTRVVFIPSKDKIRVRVPMDAV